MEKVKITAKQAEAIKEYKETVMGVFDFLHDLAGAHHINSHGEEQEEEAIRLMRAFTDGYEVEPEFKVGDYVITGRGVIGNYAGTFNGVYYFTRHNNEDGTSDNIRRATPEEIKREKERRWWDGIGRKVNEYKIDDIVSTGSIIRSVGAVWNDGNLSLEGMGAGNPYTVDEIFLVCPVEKRLDVNHES